MKGSLRFTGIALAAVGVLGGSLRAASRSQDARFRSSVEIVNIAATVSDAYGRFVPGLQRGDFSIYEDDQPQAIESFTTERLPVSLGVTLDTSGSMAGPKLEAAHAALDRFLERLLDPGDEIFLYRFSDYPQLLQGWTKDRALLAGALDHVKADGGTALYDTVADAVPLAAQGTNRKKALVVISDGNDTSSNTPLVDVRRLIRESDVLVYAIGIDNGQNPDPGGSSSSPRPAAPTPPPIPTNRRPARGGVFPGLFVQSPAARWRAAAQGDRVDADALRQLTDDSGGRTEIIRDPRDLNPATAGIADELSKQYDLTYRASGKKDGRWHAIRVEVRNRTYRVRARTGYFAN
ncbi:MAG TPA: VWA domain-containing protein [Vicinamibacterales bacterium]|jgi:VWFA-related protein|nr:VWA domain-containing protein [Vicinamibacterales bacterium]